MITTPLSQIESLLQDPFFEEQRLGRHALQRRLQHKSAENTVSMRFDRWEKGCSPTIYFGHISTPLGILLAASTTTGLCFVAPVQGNSRVAMDDLNARFRGCSMENLIHPHISALEDYLNGDKNVLPLNLHLRGTDFQYLIWQKLSQVPFGCLTTYAALGGGTKNARATGSAVGANPLFYILPCHRVVRGDGTFEGFYWGAALKRLLLASESGSL